MRLSVNHGILLNRLQHGGNDLARVHFGKVDGLVDLVLFLYRSDAILARLGQIETGAARGPQFGDHLFVVGVGGFDLDAGFLLELFHQVFGCIPFPGKQ